MLATRHDVRLGLHRLRLEGGLAEIRAADLKFSLAEARDLFAAAGAELPESAAAMLHERTEGWAAGLRLAALAVAGHPDPERFAADFSGTERTVAEYLLAEVLDRQPEEVRRLLLRTSVLARINGELADLLTGDPGGERVLQDLEQANAFAVSLDPARSWFRYHQMFADLLRLELRRTAPDQVAVLHRAACAWFAAHGYPVDAIRHAQSAGDWELATQLLADYWPGLYLDGQGVAIHDLLTGFPPTARRADARLAALVAGDELARGSLEAAEQYLGLAERAIPSVPEAQREQTELLLGIARLLVSRQRGNLPAVAEEAGRLQVLAEAPDAAQPDLGEDLRALALTTVGSAEVVAGRSDESERHLAQGVALARRIERPYLEFSGLAYQAAVEFFTRSFATATERAREAIELAERHGWTDEPAVGIASAMLADMLALQGRPAEAESWVQRAERTVRAEVEPAAGLAIQYIRGMIELARGRVPDALAALQAPERLSRRLVASHFVVPRIHAFRLLSLVRLGEVERAAQDLAGLGEQDREHAEIRIATAVLRLAQNDPGAAAAALAPVLDGSAPVVGRTRLVHAFLLEAIARDTLGEPDNAEDALEHALDLAEPDGVLLWFLLHPAPRLLERHVGHRTAHAALIAEIQGLLAGTSPASPPSRFEPLREPLSSSEVRVLRYLPTNLTAPEIARELSVSRNTVKTHVNSLYAKLGTHRRAEAVEHARALGLLAPSRVGPK